VLRRESSSNPDRADNWVGMSRGTCKVAVKVLRGGSSSNPDFLRKLKEVSPQTIICNQRPSRD